MTSGPTLKWLFIADTGYSRIKVLGTMKLWAAKFNRKRIQSNASPPHLSLTTWNEAVADSTLLISFKSRRRRIYSRPRTIRSLSWTEGASCNSPRKPCKETGIRAFITSQQMSVSWSTRSQTSTTPLETRSRPIRSWAKSFTFRLFVRYPWLARTRQIGVRVFTWGAGSSMPHIWTSSSSLERMCGFQHRMWR